MTRRESKSTSMRMKLRSVQALILIPCGFVTCMAGAFKVLEAILFLSIPPVITMPDGSTSTYTVWSILWWRIPLAVALFVSGFAAFRLARHLRENSPTGLNRPRVMRWPDQEQGQGTAPHSP